MFYKNKRNPPLKRDKALDFHARFPHCQSWGGVSFAWVPHPREKPPCGWLYGGFVSHLRLPHHIKGRESWIGGLEAKRVAGVALRHSGFGNPPRETSI